MSVAVLAAAETPVLPRARRMAGLSPEPAAELPELFWAKSRCWTGVTARLTALRKRRIDPLGRILHRREESVKAKLAACI